MYNEPHQVKHIVQELETRKETSRNLFCVLSGQIWVMVLMTAVVFAAVMSGVELSKETHVVDGNLVGRNNTPVSVKTLKSTHGLMSVTSLPTEAFGQLKATTIVFDMKGTLIALCALRFAYDPTLVPSPVSMFEKRNHPYVHA